jgi:AraC family transcriptional regulator
MYNKKDTESKKIYIKNMLCDCCVRLLRIDLEQAGITVHVIKNGFVEISYEESSMNDEKIDRILSLSGLSRINGREQRLVEELKKACLN